MEIKNSKVAELFKDKSRILVNFGIILVTLFFGISLIRNVARISKVKKDIKETEGRVEKLKTDNEELRQRLDEVKSQTFVEKQLRDRLGLAKEGETVIVLPEPEVLKKLAPNTPEEEETLPDPNWEKWYKLFF